MVVIVPGDLVRVGGVRMRVVAVRPLGGDLVDLVGRVPGERADRTVLTRRQWVHLVVEQDR